jgi:hypothetical protein
MSTTPAVLITTGGDLAPTKPVSNFKRHALLFFCAAVALLVLILERPTPWPGAGLAMDPKTVLTLLSPLLLTAGFIERAVEIIVSPWRDAGATVLANRLDTLKSLPATNDPAALLALQHAMAVAQAEFQTYKGQTQQFAFCVSMTMSLGAAIVGVRALGSFLPSSPPVGPQMLWFKMFDVVLSSCLLAGGADGIHAVVNMFTTFFDTTTQKTETAANKP